MYLDDLFLNIMHGQLTNMITSLEFQTRVGNTAKESLSFQWGNLKNIDCNLKVIKVNLNNYENFFSQFTLLDGWKELKKGLNICSIQIGTKYGILISGQKLLLKSYSASVLDLEPNWC